MRLTRMRSQPGRGNDRNRRHVRNRPLAGATGESVLDVRNLSIEIATPLGVIHPVRDVTFSVRRRRHFGHRRRERIR